MPGMTRKLKVGIHNRLIIERIIRCINQSKSNESLRGEQRRLAVIRIATVSFDPSSTLYRDLLPVRRNRHLASFFGGFGCGWLTYCQRSIGRNVIFAFFGPSPRLLQL
jgi:hypothetical protein